MKICVYDHENRKRIRLWFPLSMIKSRLFISLITSKDIVKQPMDKKKIRILLQKAYPILKYYKKKYRHFSLVDITSRDHDVVKITL